MARDMETLSKYTGSVDSKIKLWQSLNCIRSVHIAQLRAADAISKLQNIKLGAAISTTLANPQWEITKQQCER